MSHSELPRPTYWQLTLLGGVLLLPLIFWLGPELPFHTPKLWWMGFLALSSLLVCLARRIRPIGPQWPWLAWLAAVGLSASLAGTVSLEAVLLALLPVPLGWAVVHGAVEPERLEWAILAASVVQSSIALAQYAGIDPLQLTGWRPEAFANPRMRVYGTLGNPNFVAAWLCATLPLWIGVRRYRWAGALLQCAAIGATGSRVALVALPAAALALALCLPRRRWWWMAACIPLAAAIPWLSPARPLAETLEGRLYYLRASAGHLGEIPLVGYGPGSFGARFEQWQLEWLRVHPESMKFAGPQDHAHNDYLEFWVEYGAIGVVGFAGLCTGLLAGGWRLRSSRAAAWAGAAALLAIACVDFPWHRPAEWTLLWLLLGLSGKIGLERAA